jgi:hypothetical protein
MGWLNNIFGGSSYDNPGWMRDAGRNIFDQYGAMMDDYDPRAYVGQGMEDYDSMLRNSMASRGNQLAGDGFRTDSNPTGDIQRARYGSGLWSQGRKNAMDWRRNILQGQYGMLNGMHNLFSRTYKPGFAAVFGKGLGEAVTSIGSSGATDKHSAQMGGGSTANSVYGPMTPTQGEVPYNTGEGTNQNTAIGSPFKPSFSTSPGLSYQQPSWMRRRRTTGANW